MSDFPLPYTVTITGADDSTEINDLLRLSETHPRVEWGILVSKSRQGSPRFPSHNWIESLLNVSHFYRELPLSLHVCGHWARQACAGEWGFASRFGWLEDFARVQLNWPFCDKGRDLPDEFFTNAQRVQTERGFQLILQMGGPDDHALWRARAEKLDAVPLFDASGGRGSRPNEWPQARGKIYSGYAGGLGPDCLGEELPRIAAAAGRRYWIDMESQVRTDERLDMEMVQRCLEIAHGGNA